MTCKTSEEFWRTGEGTLIAWKGTPCDSANGETLRKSVFQDVVQTCFVRFDAVPKIHLWI